MKARTMKATEWLTGALAVVLLLTAGLAQAAWQVLDAAPDHLADPLRLLVTLLIERTLDLGFDPWAAAAEGDVGFGTDPDRQQVGFGDRGTADDPKAAFDALFDL